MSVQPSQRPSAGHPKGECALALVILFPPLYTAPALGLGLFLPDLITGASSRLPHLVSTAAVRPLLRVLTVLSFPPSLPAHRAPRCLQTFCPGV